MREQWQGRWSWFLGVASLAAGLWLASSTALGRSAGGNEPSAAALQHKFVRDYITVGISNAVLARGLVMPDAGFPGGFGGFGPRALQEAARAVGLEVRFAVIGSLEVERALSEGVVDAVVGVSVTPDRLEKMDFTTPLMVARGAVFARSGTAPARTAGDLKGKRVGVAGRGVAQEWCLERGVAYTECGPVRDALLAVANGEQDYLVTTMPAGRVEIERMGLTGLTEWPLQDDRLTRSFAVAVKVGNRALLSDLNDGFSVLHDSGRFERLYDELAGRYQPRAEAPEIPRSVLWMVAALGALVIAGVTTAYGMAQRRLRRGAEDLLRSKREQDLLYDEVPALVYTYYVGRDGTRRLLSTGAGVDRWRSRFPGMNPGQRWETSSGPRMHPDDVGPYREATDRSRRTGGVFAAEFRMLDKDGQYRWLHSRVVPTPVEGGTAWCALLVDVTDVREMRASLERTETLYRELFENCPEAIVMFRAEDMVVVEANPKALEVYGYERDRMLGLGMGDFLAPGEDCLPRQEALLRDGIVDFATRHVRSDGAALDVEIHASVVEIGHERRVLAIVRDVTERVRLEADLQAARQMEALGVMAGGIAHDFNNVLVGILGNASLARRQLDAPESLRASLERIEESGRFAADMVRQLMEFAGRRAWTSGRVELAGLMRQVVGALGTRVRAEVRVVGGAAWVMGDEVSIKQAAMNVLTNASDAMEGDGEIRVRVGVRRFDPASEPGCVVGRELPAGTYAFVCVEDCGRGLEDDVRARMFEPFVSTKGRGRGLGLAMVMASVRRHGGGVCVRTQAGVGTWFELLFPSAPPAQTAALARGDVLIVDDDPAVRGTVRELVSGLGFGCVEAGTGEAALVELAERPVDAVLLDVSMPGMGGWATLAEIRRRWPRLPVVLSSGNAGTGIEGLEPDGMLPKPYTLEELRAALDAAVHRRSEFSDAAAAG